MNNPIPLHLKRPSGPYGRQLLDTTFGKSCANLSGDVGAPIYDYSGSTHDSTDRMIGYGNSVFGSDNLINNVCHDDLDESCFRISAIIPSPCLQLEGARLEAQDKRLDPYSPVCMVPLPEHLIEPNFIRRRNERERERVRCVNEGYDKLKEHLPIGNKDRRISKVETLRGAIDYIRQLRRLLDNANGK